MKRILLTSTALVAFAGAAAAEVTWSGDAELGYNDKEENGFYVDLGFGIAGSAELNNGLTAGFKVNADVDVDATLLWQTTPSRFGRGPGYVKLDGYELYLKSDTAGMYAGDTNNAYEAMLKGARSGGVDVGFATPRDTRDIVIRGEGSMSGADIAVSAHTTGADVGVYQGVVKYDMGNFGIVAGIQLKDADYDGDAYDSGFGLVGTAAFGGADVTLTYMSVGSDKSTGIGLSYPVGPVTLGAYYAANETAAEGGKYNNYGLTAGYENGPLTLDAYYKVDGRAAKPNAYGIDGSYDVGNGIMIYAGVAQQSGSTTATDNGTGYYAAAEYDLGGGASALVSHANNGWELGPEYKAGTTVSVSFEF